MGLIVPHGLQCFPNFAFYSGSMRPKLGPTPRFQNTFVVLTYQGVFNLGFTWVTYFRICDEPREPQFYAGGPDEKWYWP